MKNDNMIMLSEASQMCVCAYETVITIFDLLSEIHFFFFYDSHQLMSLIIVLLARGS